MQVSSISTSSRQALSQREQFIAEMFNDLQSGDILAAQQALMKLRSEGQAQANSTPAPQATEGSSAVTKTSVDFSSLLNSIHSGDLAGAQAAWQKIRAHAATQETMGESA